MHLFMHLHQQVHIYHRTRIMHGCRDKINESESIHNQSQPFEESVPVAVAA